MDVLVTGAASGLGRFLHTQYNGDALTRQTHLNDLVAARKNRPYDLIVHCAANARRGITNVNFYDYLNDNIFLTERLTAVPHRRFIYLSSVAVYGGAAAPVREDDELKLDEPADLYALSKLMGEAIVLKSAHAPIAIRAPALLGLDARPSSLTRILTQPNVTLTLAAESTFNYILHVDILRFIKASVAAGAEGVFNIAARSAVTLGDVAARYGKTVTFGTFRYRTPEIDSEKARKLVPWLPETSLESIDRYVGLREQS